MNGLRRQLALTTRHDFGLLFWGSLVSKIGDGFTFFALAWFFAERDSPGRLAIVLVAYEIAAIAGGIALTSVMDRVSRRKLAVLDSFIRAAAVASIPLVGLVHNPGLETFVPAMAVLGFWSPAADVAQRAMTVDLVAPDELNAANGLEGFQWEIGWLLGPLLGAVIVGTFGTLQAFWIDAATFAIFGVALMFMSAVVDKLPNRAADTSPWNDLVEGFSYVRREPIMLMIIQLTAISNFTIGMVLVALPFLVIDAGGGSNAFGLVTAAGGIGGIIGSLAAGSFHWRWPATRTLSVLVIAAAIPLLAVAAGPPIWLMGALFCVANMIAAPWNVFILTLRQRLAPPHLLGRVLSLTMLVNRAGTPGGYAIGGPLVASIGAAGTLALGAGGNIANAVASLGSRPWLDCPLRLSETDDADVHVSRSTE